MLSELLFSLNLRGNTHISKNFLRILLLGATLSTKIFHEYGPWNLAESRLILRNSMDVAGPKVFSWVIGIPISEKTFWTVRMWAAGMASGGEIIKKSSKR